MMLKSWSRILLVIFTLVGITLNACNMPRETTPTQTAAGEAGLIHTYAAQTVEAEMTQAASGVEIATVASPTSGGPATTEPPAAPTDTLSPTTEAPPAASDTPEPSPTPTEIPCDRLTFVKDVTIPDGTEFSPGETFKKTWRLRNSGSCTWTSGYSLVFDSGNAMGAPAAQQLTSSTVAPDQEIDVSVNLTAPEEGGTYRGDFKLRNPSGIVFGWGEEAKSFWVEIEVLEVTGLVFDFIAQASSAEWGSGVSPVDFTGPGETELTFSGPDSDPQGFAMIKDAIKFEGGGTSGKLLETHPKMENNGYIVGRFPEYKVLTGDHITGRIGFIAKNDGSCGSGDVTFQINYTEGDDLDTMTVLEDWDETCDDAMRSIDVDLSALKGETVHFYLIVLANGDASEDWAIWSSLGIFR
jgi:hypothetical protein